MQGERFELSKALSYRILSPAPLTAREPLRPRNRSTLWTPLVVLASFAFCRVITNPIFASTGRLLSQQLLLNRFAIYTFFTSLFISSNFAFNWSSAEVITSFEDNCPVVSTDKTNSSFTYSSSTPYFCKMLSN
jgi:hypothetical protein